jgi:OTU domain-containing protein 3
MGPPKGRRVRKFVKSKFRGASGGYGGDEISKMDEQLATLGLKAVQMTGDGNCFFRAIADQLEGDEEQHAEYRKKVVDYLEEHREDFEPFLEEDVTFEEYCSTMRQDGTWAGHMELQATSLVTESDICIHRLDFPRWQIMNFQIPGTPIIQ